MTAPDTTLAASTAGGDPEPVIRNDQAVIDAAVASTAGQDVEDGVTAFVVPAGGSVAVIDRATDEHRQLAGLNPRRSVAGTITVRDETSLIELVRRAGRDDSTVVYADPVTRQVVAVLDDDWDARGGDSGGTADGGELFGWRNRRLQLALVHTPEWRRWADLDRKMIPQQTFAEHIEESLEEIRVPSAADMLEVAQSLQANMGVQFQSGVRLRDGQRQFTYREETQGTAGRNGTLEVPDEFELALVPWQGRSSAPFVVKARLRYRIGASGLSIGYVLVDVERILRTAFEEDVVAPIREAGLTVVHGTP